MEVSVKYKRVLSIVIFSLFIAVNSLPSEAIAITKIPTVKTQITIATKAIEKAEKIVNAANFNTAIAKKQIEVATIETAKIKSYGKKYIQYYNALVKRLDLVKKKINQKIQIDLNKNEGIGYLSEDKTESINIEDDKFTSPTETAKLLLFLNNIMKGSPIEDKKAQEEVPCGGIPLHVNIKYKGGNIISREIVTLYNAGYMIDTAYDKANKIVFERYYRPKTNLLYEMYALCDEINKAKYFMLDLNVLNISTETIDYIYIRNYIYMDKTINDKLGMEDVVNMIKGLNPVETSESINISDTMKISIVYKNNNDIKKENFYFTDKLMEYKAYDSKGNLLTIGFYEINKNILKTIDSLVK